MMAMMAATFSLLELQTVASSAEGPMNSFKSGRPWYDTDGNVIDAHGAGLLENSGKFYW